MALPQNRWEEALGEVERRLRPIADRPVDISDPNWVDKLKQSRPLDEAGVRERAQDLLDELLAAYATADEDGRRAIRTLFTTFRAFAWATTLRVPRTTPEGFRTHLLHFSAKDQDRDPRDATLWLDDLVEEGARAGLAVDAALAEVANLSSRDDRYGWGSTRDWLLKRRSGK